MLTSISLSLGFVARGAPFDKYGAEGESYVKMELPL